MVSENEVSYSSLVSAPYLVYCAHVKSIIENLCSDMCGVC